MIETADASSTIARIVAHRHRHDGRLTAVGVASFGPIDLHRGSRRYGQITSTPKPGWADTDRVGPLVRARGVPVGFDTDVSGAALAEDAGMLGAIAFGEDARMLGAIAIAIALAERAARAAAARRLSPVAEAQLGASTRCAV